MIELVTLEEVKEHCRIDGDQVVPARPRTAIAPDPLI